MRTATWHRSGMLLIVIVGLAAILLSLSVTFLARMRTDARESDFVVNEAQSRIMLHAAMNYIQETSRLGWHAPDTDPEYAPGRSLEGVMREGFGWTDVRGAVAKFDQDPTSTSATVDIDHPADMGPIDQFGRRMFDPGGGWPAPGSVARCPMYVHQRPPFAVEDRLVPNPFEHPDPLNERRDQSVRYPMSAPPVRPVADTWPDFALDGSDPAHADASQPLPVSVDLAWFRVYRESRTDHDGDGSPSYDVVDLTGHHGIFIITCGSGGTQGFRDYAEVEAAYPAVGDQPFDEATFDRLRAEERLLWYRVEWTASVLGGNHSSNAESGDLDGGGTDTRVHKLFRVSDQNADWGDWAQAKESEVSAARMRAGIAMAPNDTPLEGGSVARNPVGTIQWIMRLPTEPPAW